MFVKPKPGLAVRDPDTRAVLPPEGGEVKPTTWWLRRVKSRDVVITEAPREESALEDSYRFDSDEVTP
jgi:hypothetical protein